MASTLKEIHVLLSSLSGCTKELDEKLNRKLPENAMNIACYFRDDILPLMAKLRKDADCLELICDRQVWPIPTYRELLFGAD